MVTLERLKSTRELKPLTCTIKSIQCSIHLEDHLEALTSLLTFHGMLIFIYVLCAKQHTKCFTYLHSNLQFVGEETMIHKNDMNIHVNIEHVVLTTAFIWLQV